MVVFSSCSVWNKLDNGDIHLVFRVERCFGKVVGVAKGMVGYPQSLGYYTLRVRDVAAVFTPRVVEQLGIVRARDAAVYPGASKRSPCRLQTTTSGRLLHSTKVGSMGLNRLTVTTGLTPENLLITFFLPTSRNRLVAANEGQFESVDNLVS